MKVNLRFLKMKVNKKNDVATGIIINKQNTIFDPVILKTFTLVLTIITISSWLYAEIKK